MISIDIRADQDTYIVFKWIKKLLRKTDELKFEEIRLWIAMIYDDFRAFDRSDQEINDAAKEVYRDLGRDIGDYDQESNTARCETLRYFINNAKRKKKF